MPKTFPGDHEGNWDVSYLHARVPLVLQWLGPYLMALGPESGQNGRVWDEGGGARDQAPASPCGEYASLL